MYGGSILTPQNQHAKGSGPHKFQYSRKVPIWVHLYNFSGANDQENKQDNPMYGSFKYKGKTKYQSTYFPT